MGFMFSYCVGIWLGSVHLVFFFSFFGGLILVFYACLEQFQVGYLY